MAIASIEEVGSYGILPNVPGAEVPLGAFTSATNVRFKPEGAEKVFGGTPIFAGAPISAYRLIPYKAVDGSPGWIFAGAEKVYVYEGGVYTNVTRQTLGVDVDYTAEPEERWTGGIFNEKAVLYNGLDDPQYWSLATADRLVPLAGWPASTTAKIIRPYKNFLVAGNVTKGGTKYANLVKWSHAADPGFMPTSWDETDPTIDAGEFPLGETPGSVVDMLTLGDTNIVYKDDSIWRMQYIGGTFVMQFKKMSTQAGMPSKNLAVEYEVGKHLVYTGDDLVVHDGFQLKSILGRFNRSIIGEVNSSQFANAFMYVVPFLREVHLAFATTGVADGIVDKILMWNYETGAFSFRDLGQYTALAVGVANIEAVAARTWADAVEPWSDGELTWGGTADGAVYAQQKLLGQRTSKVVLLEEQTDGVDGVAFEAELVRADLGIPFVTQRPPDVSSMKFCRRVWPRLSGPAGNTIEVTVGSSMKLGDPPVWGVPQYFTIGTTEFVDCLVTGRVFALRFRSTTLATWRLFGYDLEVERIGGH